jgi:hypothetical protein
VKGFSVFLVLLLGKSLTQGDQLFHFLVLPNHKFFLGSFLPKVRISNSDPVFEAKILNQIEAQNYKALIFLKKVKGLVGI